MSGRDPVATSNLVIDAPGRIASAISANFCSTVQRRRRSGCVRISATASTVILSTLVSCSLSRPRGPGRTSISALPFARQPRLDAYDAAEQAVLRDLSKSEQRGEADRARAILLTLEGRRAGEIASVLGVHISTVRNWRGYFAHGGMAGLRRRPRLGQQAKIGPHAGAIAAAILEEDARHDGGWTLPRLCAEIARRGGPAISPRKG